MLRCGRKPSATEHRHTRLVQPSRHTRVLLYTAVSSVYTAAYIAAATVTLASKLSSVTAIQWKAVVRRKMISWALCHMALNKSYLVFSLVCCYNVPQHIFFTPTYPTIMHRALHTWRSLFVENFEIGN